MIIILISQNKDKENVWWSSCSDFNPYTDNCFKKNLLISSPYPSSIIKRQNMNLKRKFTKIKFKTIDERYITTTIA